MIQIFSDRGTDENGDLVECEKFCMLTMEMDDLPDIYDAVETFKTNTHIGHSSRAYHDKRVRSRGDDGWGGGPWYGNVGSMDNLDKLIRFGWQDAVDRTKDATGSLVATLPAAEAIRRKPRWGEDGEEFDVDRGMRGDWDVAFQEQRRLRTNGTRIVTIYGSYGGNCDRTSEEMFWNGMQLCIAADLIEQSGYQCEVIGVNAGRQWANNNAMGLMLIRAKVAGEQLRLDNMATVFAHPAVFRTYMFKGIVSLPSSTSDGLGQSVGDHKTLTHHLFQGSVNGWCPEPTIIIPEAFNKEGAIGNITKLITDLDAGTILSPDFKEAT